MKPFNNAPAIPLKREGGDARSASREGADNARTKTRRMCYLFPVALELPLARAAKAAFKKRGFAQHRILTHWPEIAGAALARHSLPVSISFPAGRREGGCLTVKAWGGIGLELQHSEPQLLERIAGYFGYRAVSRIRIVQAPVEYRP